MAPTNRSKKRDRQVRPSTGEDSIPQGQRRPTPHSLPFELQQIILNTFQIAFPIVRDPDRLRRIIQEVKGHLFNRDFSSAFERQSNLQAYALRWSAARALGYSKIFTDPKRRGLFSFSVDSKVRKYEPSDEQMNDPQDPRLVDQVNEPCQPSTRVVCIGGGAGAEFVALAAAYRSLEPSSELHVTLVDNADWSEPISNLSAALYRSPSLPSHASEAFKVRPENQPMLGDSSKVCVAFIHQDALSWPQESFQKVVNSASLCTIMFTLNELFSASLSKTTAFLLRLTDEMASGSHLLVADSPGSYSEVSLGGNKGEDISRHEGMKDATVTTKKYPMKWLLDHTLLEVANQGRAKWIKLESEDSLWFRIDQKDRERFKYAIDLENMRYQLHLYRRQ